MQHVHPNGSDVAPVKSDGTLLKIPGTDPNKAGYTLASGSTYYYYLGHNIKESPYFGVKVKWDAAAILTITVEDTDFDDVSEFSTTAGDWEKEDPSTAYVSASGGATVANATVSVPGGTAGGCKFNVGPCASLRARLKILVGGTGGVVRVASHAKE